MILVSLLLAATLSGAARPYDPLAVPETPAVAPLDLTVRDTARDRDIPIRVYLPTATTPQPVVLFSHGLGGSREGSTYLGHHWAARGYVAVFLQHPGSDSAVWRGQPVGRRWAALQGAADWRSFLSRVRDVPAVLDQLERWNAEAGHPLAGRLDLARVGMSGHSFGAITTQAVSGQSYRSALSFADPRIKAALVLSPSSPRRGDPSKAFGSVDRPWMLMTGTRDTAPIGHIDVASRLAVFPALPPGGKYELVLDGAAHSAFTDGALPGDRASRNPNHHRVILALSTAFWDAWLRGDAAARAWLDGEGAAALLEKGDRWQKK